MPTDFIPVYQPSLQGNEKRYVMDCLDSTWISSKGKYLGLFEEAIAQFVGVEFASAVSNGTVALHAALLALGIGEGDEVIVPALTYIASANAIAYTGATPVFADSLANTWQLDPADVKRKITSRTKAIMLVHLYGHPCDMDAFTALATDNNLLLIEDCAEALGTYYNGRHVGTFGHIATFSFYGNKTITTGEGGMVVTNDNTLYQRTLHFKGQGLATYRQYWHDVVGYNYRMTNICAAIGLAQMEYISSTLPKKRALAESYRHALDGLPLVIHSEGPGATHSYWMVSILLDTPRHRDPLMTYLAERKIETRPLFYPINTMPMYSSQFVRCPVAEDIARRGINLPSWPDLSSHQIERIAQEIHSYFLSAE
ncbi:DegT/DnrJ/EryC1/StrS family aminotransferase [Azospira oryzae]|uniref:DegT/DnrJ/EryC1/StrS family aminotransferase n=1 Tax=Azospira oryzae TaxID=146939 RepID=UPI001965A268|nr:DegT/DnrJ/EryC1/StrS aminotransferase family protein [Azospira oryzae]